MLLDTPYFRRLRARIRELGGAFNAHLHLDRSGTYEDTLALLRAGAERDVSHISLAAKHALIPAVHASRCYDPGVLGPRVARFLDLLVEAGTVRADTTADVTADRVGLGALAQILELKRARSAELDLRVGAYSPLGFADAEPERFRLLVEGAEMADFIGALPERDDRGDYPDHIGFDESCRRLLSLSRRLDKPIHVHVDQQNHAFEAGTERIVRVVRELGGASDARREPRIWLIHVISPSAYEESRFRDLAGELAELDIGVICCPSAALSMRQLRPVRAPTHNSMARVLELLASGVHVRIGSDNICDITSPAGTADLVAELFVLSNALRFYDLEILAMLGAGRRLGQAELARVRAHLEEDEREVSRAVEAAAPTRQT